jgi:chaperonin cofactor prefoldin
MKEVQDSSGAILFKSTPESDPLEKKITILEGVVESLESRVKMLEDMISQLQNR